jgi:aminoglycoside 6-adenylyltransferase
MTDHIARYADLMERFVHWAASRQDVHGAFVVGSRARTAQPADEWSDLDVVMFADDPLVLLEDESWVSRLGEWDISFREPTAVGIWEERRILFADGCDVDISILPTQLLDELEQQGSASVLFQQGSNVVARGYRVLLDRDARVAPMLEMMASSTSPSHLPPSQAELDQVLSDFWYHCPWITRKLRRGELAVAHECLEGNQRSLVVRLLHWHATREGHTWHGTRYLENAMPDDIREHYARTFALHTPEDIARGMREMMDLVDRLGHEIGSAYGLSVNPSPQEAGRRWTDTILEDE